jgi:tetratricopeptide (TPR) repeat protein
LQHAFLVPLLSAGTCNGTPWYTMPLVQGESLRERLSREGAMPANVVARLLRDVAEALAYAHGQGVVHRDIKPGNILLSGAHALVTDFGVAKALAASTSHHAYATGTGVALGTPAYMAPEQAAGDANVDHRADFYALGATGYEMLSGRQLFGDRNPSQLVAAHMLEKPESLMRVAPNTPKELVALIEQLLAKNPNDRPTHAQDIAETLASMISRWDSGTASTTQARVSFVRALGWWATTFVSVVGAAWGAVHWLPVPDWTLAAALLVMLAGLPILIFATWLHRPARPIAPTPTVASTTTVGRLEAFARPIVTPQRARLGGVITIILLVLSVGAWVTSRALGIGPAATLRARGVFSDTAVVFVADFDSPPKDSSLGIVVGDLLRAELSRSASSVRVVGRNVTRLALIGMGQASVASVGTALAPEVAQRTNAKVHLVGAVNQIGSGYVVRATLVETSSNRELAQFRQNASSGDAIISAADKIGRDVRGQLGASLREVRASPPLAFAITPSLPALREYSEALRLAVDFGAGDEPVRRLENAVQIDTEFASAYRLLASYAGNVGEIARSDWAAGRAFMYREKLPPSIRLMVEATYFTKPSGFDEKRAIATYQRVVDANPRNTGARNNLGLEYLRNREFDRALDTFLKNVEFDSLSSFGPHALVRAYWAAGRRQEARKYISERLSKWQPTSIVVPNSTALALSADLEIDSAVMTLERSIKAVPSPLAGSSRASTLAALLTEQGRLSDGVATYAKFQPAAADTIANLGRVPIRLAIDDWLRNRPEAVRKYLDSITVARPPGNATAFEYPWLDLSTLYARAGAPDRAKIFLAGFERSATRSMQEFNRQPLEMARGWIAVAERRYDDAIRSFRSADWGNCVVCALPPLAHAYDLANQTDSTIAVFERYLAANDLFRVSTDQEYLAGAYKRLGELYEAKADRQKAAHYYAKFVDLWKNADPDLQPFVAEVRKRLARLSESERK